MNDRAVRLTLAGVDLLLAGTAVVAGAAAMIVRRAVGRRPAAGESPRLLVLNSSYSLDLLRAREAEHLVTHRDLGGYFEHVWSVHPLVGADPMEPAHIAAGPPTITRLNDVHTMVEGKTGRLDRLTRLPVLNFALAQVQLVLLLDGLVRREGISIVRGDPYYNGLVALLLGRLNDRLVEIRVVANHDAVYETVGALAHPRLFRRRAVEQRVVRCTLGRADLVLVGNDDHHEFALRNGARSERVDRIGNWGMVNPIHLTEPAERPVLDTGFGLGDRPVVACVSRLEWMKHPEDVIEIVAKARERHPSLAAVMIGDGAIRAELEEMCAQLGVTEHVVFAGDRGQHWIASMLPQATVIAAPIAGLGLVESALSGTPIVAYDYDWHAELLRQRQDAILVGYRDTDAMAAAICEVVEHPELAARLAASARSRAVQYMDPTAVVAQERALADHLLALAAR